RYFRVTSSEPYRQVLVGVWSVSGDDAGAMAAKHDGGGVLGKDSSGRIGAQKDDRYLLRNSTASARSAHRWPARRPRGCIGKTRKIFTGTKTTTRGIPWNVI